MVAIERHLIVSQKLKLIEVSNGIVWDQDIHLFIL